MAIQKGDDILVFPKTNGEHLALEPGIQPAKGDNMFVHPGPAGEYLTGTINDYITNGISSIMKGDNILTRSMIGHNGDKADEEYIAGECGVDAYCYREPPMCGYIPGTLNPVGGATAFWHFDHPIYVQFGSWFPILYITTANRIPVWTPGNVASLTDFQNWYPYGRLRIYFSEDNLPCMSPEKSWFGTDDLPPNIFEIGDVTCNATQSTYVWPCDGTIYGEKFCQDNAGAWIFRESLAITDIYVHIRNTSSTFWPCTTKATVTSLRVCYEDHPDWIKNGGMPDNQNYGTGPPTTGFHRKNDYVLNVDPSGDPHGWVCYATGTPGVWMPITLESSL